MNLNELSKTVSHALRHEPWVYEIELDEQGWTSIAALLYALQSTNDQWKNLQSNDLVMMIAASKKKRHEIDGQRIRAMYGHSVAGRLAMTPAEPPEFLYHGTSPESAHIIQAEGLKPMGRQYVHLSADLDTAREVGKRKSPTPILLAVSAKQANEKGIAFFHGNEKVWLADQVPFTYISPLQE